MIDKHLSFIHILAFLVLYSRTSFSGVSSHSPFSSLKENVFALAYVYLHILYSQFLCVPLQCFQVSMGWDSFMVLCSDMSKTYFVLDHFKRAIVLHSEELMPVITVTTETLCDDGRVSKIACDFCFSIWNQMWLF